MVPTHDDDNYYSNVEVESEDGELYLDNSPKGAHALEMYTYIIPNHKEARIRISRIDNPMGSAPSHHCPQC